MFVEKLRNFRDRVFSKVGSLFKCLFLKKDNILNLFQYEVDVISGEILPLIDVFKSSATQNTFDVSFMDKGEAKEVLAPIARALEIKGKNYEVINYIQNVLQDIIDNEVNIEKFFRKCFNGTVTDKTITTKEAAALAILERIVQVRIYTLDLMLFLTSLTGSKFEVSTKYKENLLKNGVVFGYSIKALKTKELINEMDKISEMPALDLNVDSEVGSPSVVNTDNFVGNPIYHLGIWIVDFKHKFVYERIKTQKESVELLLTDLKMQADGVNDPDIEKRIKYYENLLQEYDYKIKKMEQA